MSLEIAPFGPMLRAQTKVELIRLLRIPWFTIATVVFPVMFYSFFGLEQAHMPYMNATVGLYLLASFSAYAVMSLALFSFGASVAAERGSGATRLMRAAPLRPLAYFAGKCIASLAFGGVAILLLVLFARVTGGAALGLPMLAALLVRLLLGSLPFVALGFAVGYMAGLNASVAILNLITLPLAFASGLFVPIDQLPPFVQAIAPYLPTYHLGQLAWGAVGATSEPWHRAALWLLGYGALFTWIAVRAYYREERKEFA
ncbi:MAG: ABC transporter permease [Candidatus Baltobacteraceae bacterium]